MRRGLIARLRLLLDRYAAAVRRSRAELAESTAEDALPPIPAGDRHRPATAEPDVDDQD